MSMGVYIKDMEMPMNCSDCPICYDMMECTVAEPIIKFHREELEQFDFCTERHPRCPSVPVPPHGRLIDADEAIGHLFNGEQCLYSWDEIEDAIDATETIIPAEEG
jgi:hypothetical protein